MRLATHLGKTLDEVMAGTTASQFQLWNAYLDHEYPNAFRPEDNYWAQIAHEIYLIRRMLAGEGRPLDLKDFILRFDVHKPKPRKKPAPDKSRGYLSKMTWLGIAGIKVVKKNERIDSGSDGT